MKDAHSLPAPWSIRSPANAANGSSPAGQKRAIRRWVSVPSCVRSLLISACCLTPLSFFRCVEPYASRSRVRHSPSWSHVHRSMRIIRKPHMRFGPQHGSPHLPQHSCQLSPKTVTVMSPCGVKPQISHGMTAYGSINWHSRRRSGTPSSQVLEDISPHRAQSVRIADPTDFTLIVARRVCSHRTPRTASLPHLAICALFVL
jgi:hypothetical protein